MKNLEYLRDFIEENEIIGKYDIIPGLKPQHFLLPDSFLEKNRNISETTLLSCIGESEVVIENENNNNTIIKIPNKVNLLPCMKILLKDLIISIPNLNVLENKLKIHLSKLYKIENNRIIILNRKLNINLHNGHTVIGTSFRLFIYIFLFIILFIFLM